MNFAPTSFYPMGFCPNTNPSLLQITTGTALPPSIRDMNFNPPPNCLGGFGQAPVAPPSLTDIATRAMQPPPCGIPPSIVGRIINGLPYTGSYLNQPLADRIRSIGDSQRHLKYEDIAKSFIEGRERFPFEFVCALIDSIRMTETDMTDAAYTRRNRQGSSASGAYQIMPPTLQGMNGSTAEALMAPPPEQDKVIFNLLCFYLKKYNDSYKAVRAWNVGEGVVNATPNLRTPYETTILHRIDEHFRFKLNGENMIYFRDRRGYIR